MSEKTVYQVINDVQKELAATGITKGQKNTHQGFSFRGIDDVYNVLSPIMAKHGLVILPRVIGRKLVEGTSNRGSVLYSVTVKVEYDLICADNDSSKHTVCVMGEAMDSQDKATSKAMSAAYKYMAFQVFAIPTEGDNDADASSPHPAPRPVPTKKQQRQGHHVPSTAKLHPQKPPRTVSDEALKRIFDTATEHGWTRAAFALAVENYAWLPEGERSLEEVATLSKYAEMFARKANERAQDGAAGGVE